MLTKARVSTIQDDITAALRAVSAKHNLSMSGTRISYTGTDFKLTTVFADKEETGGEDVNPTLLRNLQRNGFMYGLRVDMLHKEFDSPQGRMKLAGLRGKFAIGAPIAGGQSWRFPANWVATQLSK